MRHIRSFFTSMLVLTVLIVSYHAPVNAIENGGIGARPANPDPNNPRSQSIFVYSPNLGEVVNDGVLLSNTTDSEKTLLIYAVDSVISSDGAFACAQSVEKKTDVGSWINLEKDEVKIAPKTKELVQFTLNVPTRSDVGEHDGCLIIQDKAGSDNQSVSSGVVLSFRSAIRIVATIPGRTFKDISIISVTSSSLPKHITISPKLQNKGNVSSDVKIDGQLKSLFGTTQETNGGSFPILPRANARWNFEVPKPFWGGLYRVATVATFDPNASNKLGVQSGAIKSISKNGSLIFISPHPIAAIIELLAVSAFISAIIFYVRKHYMKKRVQKHWANYTVKDHDTLLTIAKGHNVTWKNLARSNKLKSPYILESGMKIKVPPKSSEKQTGARNHQTSKLKRK